MGMGVEDGNNKSRRCESSYKYHLVYEHLLCTPSTTYIENLGIEDGKNMPESYEITPSNPRKSHNTHTNTPNPKYRSLEKLGILSKASHSSNHLKKKRPLPIHTNTATTNNTNMNGNGVDESSSGNTMGSSVSHLQGDNPGNEYYSAISHSFNTVYVNTFFPNFMSHSDIRDEQVYICVCVFTCMLIYSI